VTSSSRFVAVAAIALLLSAPSTVLAQDDGPSIRAEWRADLFLASVDAAHAGIGSSTDLGAYARLDATLGVGAAWIGSEAVASGRADLGVRFLLDPYHQERWGVYGGAGVSTRYEDGPGARVLLTLFAGAELPGDRPWRPAVEAGIGGGVRVGLVLRPRRQSRR
jgi:hypothetical protein